MSGRSIVIGTAGHIDHGKSALVRALTGTDPDRLKEERERGITIDLGFAHDVARGRAADEPTRRNRQVGPFERPEDTTPNETGRTVGADDPAAIHGSIARQDPPPAAVALDVSRA